MYYFVTIGLLFAVATALPTNEIHQSESLDCLEEDDLFSCFLVKASSALDRAARSNDVDLISGVTFVRNIPMERTGKSLKTESELLNELPRDASDRTLKLVTMIYESAVSFLKTHNLKINVPDQSFSRALIEGRGKIKKLLLPLIAAAGVKIFALVPIVFGSLALLVLKALFVGKIALLIAGILAFQKIFSGGSSSNPIGGNFFSKPVQPTGAWNENLGGQGWAAGGGAQTVQQGYHYKRSFDDVKSDAQNLAYSSHVPNTED